MNWDKYFLDLCNTVASNSKCLSRHIGAVIVRDKSPISTGYNGPPKSVPHCGLGRISRDLDLAEKLKNKYNIDYHNLFHISEINTTCPRKLLGYKSGEGLDICPAAHAERNAIVNAARYGIAVDGCKMYMNCPVPCGECMKEIINAGIVEIICTKFSYYDDLSKYLVDNSDIKLRTFEL